MFERRWTFFFAGQFLFADEAARYLIGLYLIGLGPTAVAFALFLPRGLWSPVDDRRHVQSLPAGYHLRRRTSDPSTSAEET
ncbi:hypothetical protein [Streptomyces sp. NPDC007264]|uniref:hypothetical protein n=1 Tax=Streptomyces sp. NPDC007264 TaxID=3364777 RepID=UPI0036DEC83A